MKIRGFLLALCVLVCFALNIQADCVQKVTHISEAEIPEVERSLNARILKISTKQAELILAEMRVRDPESKNILFSPFRALQIAQRESVTYNALTELMDSALICHEFRNQSDVLVRFQANIRLAAICRKTSESTPPDTSSGIHRILSTLCFQRKKKAKPSGDPPPPWQNHPR
jgi:hypothetical protein